MKQKINVTIEEDKLKLVDKLLQFGKYRNKSHIFEYSLIKLLQEEFNDGN